MSDSTESSTPIPSTPSPMPDWPNQALLQRVADAEYGGDIYAMLETVSSDSIAPGICITCHYIEYRCEPDMDDGLCEDCDTPTIKSVLILAELV